MRRSSLIVLAACLGGVLCLAVLRARRAGQARPAPDRAMPGGRGAQAVGSGGQPPPSTPAAAAAGPASVATNAPGAAAAAQPLTIDPRVTVIVCRTNTTHHRIEAVVALNNAGAELEFEEDLDALASVLDDIREEDTLRHVVANLLQRHHYAKLTDILEGILDNPEEGYRFRVFCVQHLWRRGARVPAERERLRGMLQALMKEDRHPEVRREALLALATEGDAEARAEVLRLLADDRAGEMHDLAIRCVREMGLRERLPRIRELLVSGNEPVKVAALVTLSQWQDSESRAAIEEAADSSNVRVARAARKALARLDAVREAQ